MRATYLWLLQLVTGTAIAVLLGGHLLSMHLRVILRFFGVSAAELTSWGAIIGQASQGIWIYLYMVLLALLLYHGLYGLRNIILELTPSVKTERIVTWVFIAIGSIVFIWSGLIPVTISAN